MSRIRDVANILSGGSSAIATDAEITSAVSAQFVTGKNKIINGDFGVWQRGTSITGTGTETYSADRFLWVGDGSGGTRTFSRQTMGYGDIAGYEYPYFFRFNQSVAGSGASYNYICQRIENANSFAGQTVTFSFWAKASASTTLPAIYARQRFGSGGSSETSTTVTSNIALTTSWQRFNYTFTVPSIAGKTVGSGSYLTMDVYHPINTTFTIDTFGWQLEAGSTATNFTTATGTLQGELAACQRYYQRLEAANNAAQMAIGPGWAFNSNGADLVYKLATEMRVAPTTLDYSSLSHFQWQGVTTNSVPASIAYDTNINSRYNAGVTFAKTSGYTAGGNYIFLVNSSSAYIGFGAEL
jgi:hypothetical protein